MYHRCRAVYRARLGPHQCGKETAYCSMCRAEKPLEHNCHWSIMTEQQKSRTIAKQEAFSWAFFDIETTQTFLNEAGERKWLTEHYCTTIILVKVSLKRS